MSIDIPPWIVDEMEDRREKERILWRRNARLAREAGMRAGREAAAMEARAEELEYPVVRARVGAVKEGRERSQVSLVLVCFYKSLLFCLLVRKFVFRW